MKYSRFDVVNLLMFAHYILKLISAPAFVFVYLDCPPCCSLIGQEVINKQSDIVLDFNLRFSKSFEKLKKAKKKKKKWLLMLVGKKHSKVESTPLHSATFKIESFYI